MPGAPPIGEMKSDPGENDGFYRPANRNPILFELNGNGQSQTGQPHRKEDQEEQGVLTRGGGRWIQGLHR